MFITLPILSLLASLLLALFSRLVSLLLSTGAAAFTGANSAGTIIGVSGPEKMVVSQVPDVLTFEGCSDF